LLHRELALLTSLMFMVLALERMNVGSAISVWILGIACRDRLCREDPFLRLPRGSKCLLVFLLVDSEGDFEVVLAFVGDTDLGVSRLIILERR
jgi:hypothetical protein